ncbi:MAG: YggS family pyridoxal phosphate-dependent enzyme [Desulfomonilia bacterium]
MGIISENARKILSEIPGHVRVVAAAKARTAGEIREVIEAGVTLIGENYVQEARAVIPEIRERVGWHFIGHIQTNKVKYIVPLFDMIETVDSAPLAQTIDRLAGRHGKIMPVLVEVNSAQEPQKAGLLPEDVLPFIRQIHTLEHIRVQGLMTMGPFLDDPEHLRPYFRATRELFVEVAGAAVPRVEMKHLSMGMSDSYRIAIEEGASLVRIGTRIFGTRNQA